MIPRTVTCPNNCPPSDLEREHWQQVEHEDVGAPFGVRYTCRCCGFEADWNPRQGLMVNDDGKRGMPRYIWD